MQLTPAVGEVIETTLDAQQPSVDSYVVSIIILL